MSLWETVDLQFREHVPEQVGVQEHVLEQVAVREHVLEQLKSEVDFEVLVMALSQEMGIPKLGKSGGTGSQRRGCRKRGLGRRL